MRDVNAKHPERPDFWIYDHTSDTKFFEFKGHYSYFYPVEEITVGDKTHYKLNTRGEEETYEITKTRIVGGDVCISEVLSIENDIKIPNSLAAFQISAIEAYLKFSKCPEKIIKSY
jgi:hypothetical protein